MAGTEYLTPQSGIKEYDSNDIFDYSLFLGGTNSTLNALKQYDPLKTGYNRIFFVQMPKFMQIQFKDKTDRIRHLMEYGFTKISGIGNVTLDTEQITGGYSARQFEIGTVSKDETNSISIGMYEFAGSPIREYMDLWISGISDPYTGLGHYHGALEAATNKSGIAMQYAQHNHVAEAIYVATDPTGKDSGIEYACLLSNMFPKGVKKDHFDYESGNHPLVQVDLEFTCTKYESPQINEVAKALIRKSQIMRNYLNFKIEYGVKDAAGNISGTGYALDRNNIEGTAKEHFTGNHKTDFKNWKTENYYANESE